jgi:hypothetical protein
MNAMARTTQEPERIGPIESGQDSPAPTTRFHPRDPGRRLYLSAQQLAELTPWSVHAIHHMVARGILKRNVHYFVPVGRRAMVFKWSSIVALIEGPELMQQPDEREPAPERCRGVMDVERAAEELQRLLS